MEKNYEEKPFQTLQTDRSLPMQSRLKANMRYMLSQQTAKLEGFEGTFFNHES